VKVLSVGINGVLNGKPNSKRNKGNGSVQPNARSANDGNGSKQARIERLLKDASAFQQAGVIRKYVEAIRLSLSSSWGLLK
jgi:hypothetical protein